MVGVVALDQPARLAADDDQYTNNNPQNRPGGSLVRDPATQQVYLVEGNGKRLFPAIQDLDSHRYSGFIGVHDVSADELSRLPTNANMRAREGTVFRNPANGAIYIIDELSPGSYLKRYVTAAAWSSYFNYCGVAYGYTDVDSAYLNGYTSGPNVDPATSLRPDGQLVKVSSSSTTVYLLAESGKKRQFVTANDRLTHNFPYPVCADALVGTGTYPAGDNIRGRAGTLVKSSSSPDVYVVDHGGGASYAKRHMTSPDSFAFYGFASDPIQIWSSSEVSGYATGAHVHPVKSLLPDNWYKSLITNDLTMHRMYGAGMPSGVWNPLIDGARNAYSNGPIVVDFVEQPPSSNNDVWVDVANYPGVTWWGLMTFLTEGATVRHAHIKLNNLFGPSQAIAVHELGHSINLAHDGLDPDANGDGVEERDLQCGAPRVPQTIEDYDCYLQYPFLNTPANWDYCGVNHKYYSATWGWSGC
ncbi:MAG: hypothetical protein Q7T33_02390 [Dehalococcoidia bacterium]|nr:hypothetical protein [Dehalococcoidia bacterium]